MIKAAEGVQEAMQCATRMVTRMGKCGGARRDKEQSKSIFHGTGMVCRIGMIALFWFAASASACEYPDLGNLPLRRAVTKVKLLPETEAWANYIHKTGAIVQYALLLEQPITHAGRCYWTVEAIAEGKVWRRFYVTPDGKRVLDEDRKPAAAPRAARPSVAAKAGAR
jgi:hypothetical protein